MAEGMPDGEGMAGGDGEGMADHVADEGMAGNGEGMAGGDVEGMANDEGMAGDGGKGTAGGRMADDGERMQGTRMPADGEGTSRTLYLCCGNQTVPQTEGSKSSSSVIPALTTILFCVLSSISRDCNVQDITSILNGEPNGDGYICITCFKQLETYDKKQHALIKKGQSYCHQN